MRIQMYGILISVFLCVWSVLSTDNQEEGSTSNQAERIDATFDHLIRLFALFHASDRYYHSAIRKQPIPDMIRETKEYALQIAMYSSNSRNPLQSSAKKPEIMRQYVYINTTILQDFFKDYKRENIMLNFFLTMHAYEAAVHFRVCSFIYFKADKHSLKYTECLLLSSYMEWYFSFMFEEKLKGFCEISRYFDYNEGGNKPLKAEHVCKILRKLNLNFLRFPEDERSIHLLEHDENNVFNPDILTMYDPYGRRHFISVFERYKVPSKTKYQSQDDYNKKVYDEIWDLIMQAYTEKYFTLIRYTFEVTYGLPYSINSYWKPDYDYIKKNVWDRMHIFTAIVKLPSSMRRGAVSDTMPTNSSEKIVPSIGDKIFRSNAVEILRQVSRIFNPLFINVNIIDNSLMVELNSGKPRCHIKEAPPTLIVDYTFTCIDILKI